MVKIADVIKTSLIDYPFMVSYVMFFQGCQLKCPFCVGENMPIMLHDFTTKNSQDITIGDKFHTPFGETEVVGLIEDVSERYEIEFEDGRRIVVGDSHMFSSGGHLLYANKLKVGDILSGI